MRIYRNGEFFSEGYDLDLIAFVAGEASFFYSFHPDDYRNFKLAEVNAACEAELSALQSAYPQSEVLSWDKQEREARAFLSDPTAPVPLIAGLAAARGISVSTLAQRIVQKADAYTAAIAAALGKRQKLEDRLNSETDWVGMSSINW